MNLKIHFLESQLDFFPPEDLDEVSNEPGERFRQDIMVMEKRYQGKRTSSMLSDCCWIPKRVVPDFKYRRKPQASTI
jgi:hypothetical protein